MTLINKAQLLKVVEQMKKTEKEFDDEMADYFHGELISYFFNKTEQTYCVRKADTIAASYITTQTMKESEFIEALSQFHTNEFEEQGFILYP